MTEKLLEELLQKVLTNQESIFQRLDLLEAKITIISGDSNRNNIIDELPNHLRITLDVIQEEGEVTASHISSRTGRSRNLESMYCCQLERMGLLERRSEGRKQFFALRYNALSHKNSQYPANNND